MNDFWACEEDEEICVYKTGNWGGNLFYIVLLFLFFVSQFFLAYGDLASECAQNSFLLRRNCKCRKHFCCCPIACSRRQGQILTYSKNAGEESKQRVIFKKSDRLRHYKIWLFGISCLMASFFPKTCTQEITLPCHFINIRNNNNSWPFYVSTSLSWFISTFYDSASCTRVFWNEWGKNISKKIPPLFSRFAMSGGGGEGTDRARINICGHVGFPPLKLRGGEKKART